MAISRTHPVYFIFLYSIKLWESHMLDKLIYTSSTTNHNGYTHY